MSDQTDTWTCPKCGCDDPLQHDIDETVKKCLACGCQITVLIVDPNFTTSFPDDSMK